MGDKKFELPPFGPNDVSPNWGYSNWELVQLGVSPNWVSPKWPLSPNDVSPNGGSLGGSPRTKPVINEICRKYEQITQPLLYRKGCQTQLWSGPMRAHVSCFVITQLVDLAMRGVLRIHKHTNKNQHKITGSAQLKH